MQNYQKQIRAEWEQTRIGSKALEDEAGLDGKAARLVFLTELQSDLELERDKLRHAYGEHIVKDRPYIERWFIVRSLEEIGKEMEKIKIEVDKVIGFSNQFKDGFTREDIERAKQYPIENIIEVNKQDKALCIDHKEKTPSLLCRSFFVFCFGCGYRADHIEVMMKVRGVGFREAVGMMI